MVGTSTLGIATGSSKVQKYAAHPQSGRWYRLINEDDHIRKAIQANTDYDIIVAKLADTQNQLWAFDEADYHNVKGQRYSIRNSDHGYLCIRVQNRDEVFCQTDPGHSSQRKWYLKRDPGDASGTKLCLKSEVDKSLDRCLGYDEDGRVEMRRGAGTIWLLEETRRTTSNAWPEDTNNDFSVQAEVTDVRTFPFQPFTGKGNVLGDPVGRRNMTSKTSRRRMDVDPERVAAQRNPPESRRKEQGKKYP